MNSNEPMVTIHATMTEDEAYQMIYGEDHGDIKAEILSHLEPNGCRIILENGK